MMKAMNIIDLRSGKLKLKSGLPEDTIKYLKTVIPSDIPTDSTELVKSINSLIWGKGIPIYLVDEVQMPEEYNYKKEDQNPPTDFLGYYKYVDFGKVKMESIFLCMDRIGVDKQKLAKVLLHEIGHAIMEARVGDYGYSFKADNIIKFMEESLANYIVLKYLNEINNQESLLDYSIKFIKNQGFGYNFGVKWFEWDNRNYKGWIALKTEITGGKKTLTFKNVVLYKSIVCYCDSSKTCVGNHNSFYNLIEEIFPDEIEKLERDYNDQGYWKSKDKAAIHCGIINL